MTIHLTRYCGITLQIGRGSDDRRYLYGVIWYPRSRKRIGYLYPSVRWF